MNIVLKIGNTYDVPGYRFSEPFYIYKYLDKRHALSFWNRGKKERIERATEKGKEINDFVVYYEQFEIEFICDVDFAHIVGLLKNLDYLLITINDIEVTPDEWDTEITDVKDFNECFRKCKIIYRANFSQKLSTKKTIITNSAPVAQSVYISAPSNTVGSVLTGTYTYYDADGDAEGTSTFKWYRANTSEGAGLQLISGQTAQTYTITTSDYNKYIFFQVTPIAATGETTGTPVRSAGIAAETNAAPTASSLSMSSESGNFEIREDWTGSYTYNDSDGDLEDTSIYYWQRADYFDEENKPVNSFRTGDALIETIGGSANILLNESGEQIGKYMRFGVMPKAATGIQNTEIYWSGWQIINDQTI